MSLAVLLTKNCLCSSMLQVLPKVQTVHLQPIHHVPGRLAGTCSSNVFRINSAFSSSNVSNKLAVLDTTSLRLFSTSVPVLSDPKSSVYKPKTQFEEIKPERNETPSKFQKSLQNVFLKKLSFLTSSSVKRASGYTLYQLLSNHVDFKEFFRTYSMPDTFNSWFIVMELHVWMLSVRLMADGVRGKDIRNHLIEAMWEDVKMRAKEISSGKQLKEGAHTLSSQFTAAFLGYDEGLQSNDHVLAAAVWRRFFNKECNDPYQVESLVSFIRKQIHLLDQLSHEDIIDRQKIILLKLSH